MTVHQMPLFINCIQYNINMVQYKKLLGRKLLKSWHKNKAKMLISQNTLKSLKKKKNYNDTSSKFPCKVLRIPLTYFQLSKIRY